MLSLERGLDFFLTEYHPADLCATLIRSGKYISICGTKAAEQAVPIDTGRPRLVLSGSGSWSLLEPEIVCRIVSIALSGRYQVRGGLRGKSYHITHVSGLCGVSDI